MAKTKEKKRERVDPSGVGIADRQPGAAGRGKRRSRLVLPDQPRAAAPREGGEGGAGVDKSWWTPERERALDLLFSGMSKSRAAKELGRNRETVVLWSQNPLFKAKLSERLADHVNETRLRRIRQTTHFADKSAAQLERTMKVLDENPTDLLAQARASLWIDKFKVFRSEERIDFGDDVKRSQVSVLGHVDVNQQTSHEISLKAFLADGIKSGSVRPDLMPASDDPAIIVSTLLGQALLGAPPVMDILNEEDLERLEQKK